MHLCLIQTIEGATTYCRPVCYSVLAGTKVTFPSEINKKIDGFAAYETFKIFMSLPGRKTLPAGKAPPPDLPGGILIGVFIQNILRTA